MKAEPTLCRYVLGFLGVLKPRATPAAKDALDAINVLRGMMLLCIHAGRTMPTRIRSTNNPVLLYEMNGILILVIGNRLRQSEIPIPVFSARTVLAANDM